MDRYSVKKVIGQGSYGQALLCERKVDNKKCIVKQISIAKLSSKEKKKTEMESTLLSKLSHPNIVAFWESFWTPKHLHIVMEFADGGDLENFVKRRKTSKAFIPQDQVLHLFVQISLAIKHIHDRKILHRDLKSQNVFLTSKGLCKLGDFGVSRVLENTNEMARTQVGTPYYMSPEIMNNERYNSKTDMWSLGCILYELMCLQLPFQGKDLRSLSYNILNGKQPNPPGIYSTELTDLVKDILAKDPKKRPSIGKVLERPVIRQRISNFLDPTKMQNEFSHTIMHGVNILDNRHNIDNALQIAKRPQMPIAVAIQPPPPPPQAQQPKKLPQNQAPQPPQPPQRPYDLMNQNKNLKAGVYAYPSSQQQRQQPVSVQPRANLLSILNQVEAARNEAKNKSDKEREKIIMREKDRLLREKERDAAAAQAKALNLAKEKQIEAEKEKLIKIQRDQQIREQQRIRERTKAYQDAKMKFNKKPEPQVQLVVSKQPSHQAVQQLQQQEKARIVMENFVPQPARIAVKQVTSMEQEQQGQQYVNGHHHVLSREREPLRYRVSSEVPQVSTVPLQAQHKVHQQQSSVQDQNIAVPPNDLKVIRRNVNNSNRVENEREERLRRFKEEAERMRLKNETNRLKFQVDNVDISEKEQSQINVNGSVYPHAGRGPVSSQVAQQHQQHKHQSRLQPNSRVQQQHKVKVGNSEGDKDWFGEIEKKMDALTDQLQQFQMGKVPPPFISNVTEGEIVKENENSGNRTKAVPKAQNVEAPNSKDRFELRREAREKEREAFREYVKSQKAKAPSSSEVCIIKEKDVKNVGMSDFRNTVCHPDSTSSTSIVEVDIPSRIEISTSQSHAYAQRGTAGTGTVSPPAAHLIIKDSNKMKVKEQFDADRAMFKKFVMENRIEQRNLEQPNEIDDSFENTSRNYPKENRGNGQYSNPRKYPKPTNLGIELIEESHEIECASPTLDDNTADKSNYSENEIVDLSEDELESNSKYVLKNGLQEFDEDEPPNRENVNSESSLSILRTMGGGDYVQRSKSSKASTSLSVKELISGNNDSVANTTSMDKRKPSNLLSYLSEKNKALERDAIPKSILADVSPTPELDLNINLPNALDEDPEISCLVADMQSVLETPSRKYSQVESYEDDDDDTFEEESLDGDDDDDDDDDNDDDDYNDGERGDEDRQLNEAFILDDHRLRMTAMDDDSDEASMDIYIEKKSKNEIVVTENVKVKSQAISSQKENENSSRLFQRTYASLNRGIDSSHSDLQALSPNKSTGVKSVFSPVTQPMIQLDYVGSSGSTDKLPNRYPLGEENNSAKVRGNQVEMAVGLHSDVSEIRKFLVRKLGKAELEKALQLLENAEALHDDDEASEDALLMEVESVIGMDGLQYLELMYRLFI